MHYYYYYYYYYYYTYIYCYFFQFYVLIYPNELFKQFVYVCVSVCFLLVYVNCPLFVYVFCVFLS
jgi:hypothetical protein